MHNFLTWRDVEDSDLTTTADNIKIILIASPLNHSTKSIIIMGQQMSIVTPETASRVKKQWMDLNKVQ